MCGIAGILGLDGPQPAEALGAAAQAMARTLRHRGPDDDGVWVDSDSGIALAHRRLSILDLSPAGHQPMISESGRYVISYNGEIYNFVDLRRKLEQETGAMLRLRGGSDTETMLACFERWGIEESLKRWNGMFALAVWDRKDKALFLARDRFGEKPLYYARMRRSFLFGSELKALRAHPDFCGEIDRDALALYLRYNCIPAPRTIFRGVWKLPPETWMCVTHEAHENLQAVPYWSLRQTVERSMANPFRGTVEEAAVELEFLLNDAVKIRMLADVPIGVFLSGGIDSSVLAALMQVQSSRPVRSFSIGMSESAYDESRNAREVARHLGTEHCEFRVTPADALATIPRLASVYDEPFADSSQIPTLLLAELTRRFVTVGLSGDGGDEMFGGYNRHIWSGRLAAAIRVTPGFSRRLTGAAICRISTRSWDRCFDRLRPVVPRRLRHRTPGSKLHKFADVLAAADPASAYQRLVSHWRIPSKVVLGAREFSRDLPESPEGMNYAETMMFYDAETYLPDDILVKVDRATMAASLEARAPYLDPRVVEFAWRLGFATKVRGGEGKIPLRRILYRHVPRALVDRPKFGFGIPLDSWLRGPLREWAEALLDATRLRNEGYFEPHPIRRMWSEHLAGHGAWQHHLWDILMFEQWLENNGRAAVSGDRVPTAAFAQ
ncbi:MAG TPA: asparagine synthase (glutamine-hydrolyzing) [Candidatus Acidoferrales bacterium]|nr:asparagine synthase (glutamine-hydrolyzing) [Candidatus Acidoferrales bacterium]